MIDSSHDKPQKNKSLSADSELNSAYDYLKNREFKLCKRLIDKKIPKLKSEIDKINFNIVKMLLLFKTKKFKEVKKLVDSVKKEVIENPNLNSNNDLMSYFKNVLRELNEEIAANEIFRVTIKNYNLAKISRKLQFSIMKELTLNYEFQDLSSKISAFLKNENDPDLEFLMLMKYEIIYILVFKQSKLSKVIANLTLKEMIQNFSKFSSVKGFIDILVKYLISLNDVNTFIDLFENKKTEFTNSPIEDILIDIYFQKDDSAKLINFLIRSIKNNLEECNFISYQRLINYTFYYYEKNSQLNKINIELVLDKILEDNQSAVEFYQNISFENLDDPNYVLNNLLKFLEITNNSVIDKKINFNAYKSCLLAKLTFYHNLIMSNPLFISIIESKIYETILEILENSVMKQSILTEISKFFIYLDSEQRNNILLKYRPCEASISQNENLPEKMVFYLKLGKMLNVDDTIYNDLTTKIISILISELARTYLKITSNHNKLEKGERMLGDDLIILINEYLFEYINRNKYNKKSEESLNLLIRYVFSLNTTAHERSPYNYDITLFYLKTAGILNMPAKVLDILKFMNLKGPQFETVSYIAFIYFLNTFYRPGFSYLIEQLDTWDLNNKKSVRKTLWQMFTGRNFWNTDELLTFLQENENSYYKHLLNYMDLLLSFNDNLTFSHEDDEVRKENFINLLGLMVSEYNKFEKISAKITKNQDMIVSIFKFKQIDYFNKNFEILKNNRNFDVRNYRYKIDSVWKNNILYELYPSYKNNYLIQDDCEVLGIFDDMKFLTLRILSRVIFANIFDKVISEEESNALITKYYEVFNSCSSDDHNDFIIYDTFNINLLNIFKITEGKYENLINDENVCSIEKNYASLSSLFIDKTKELRENLNFYDRESQTKFYKHFNFFKHFFLPELTFVTSKFIDIVNNCNKKVHKDSGTFKLKFTNNFKSPMINFFIENEAHLVKILKLENEKSTNMMLYDFLILLTTEDAYFNKELVQVIYQKYLEEQNELFKGAIESTKVMKIFIKDNI